MTYRPSWRSMDRAEYRPVATLRPRRWTWRRDRLELWLEERKRAWDVPFPLGTYRVGAAPVERTSWYWTAWHWPTWHWTAWHWPLESAFAAVVGCEDADAEGRPVPVILGRVYDVPAVVLDREARVFHLAAHRLSAVTAVYVGGAQVQPSAVDLAAATVTLAQWDGTSRVTADVVGAPGDAGPILNPADAVEYLLRGAGATDADLFTPAASDPLAGRGFGAHGARLAWAMRTDTDGIERASPEVSWYIRDRKPLLEHIEDLLAQVGGLQYTNGSGQLVLRPWALLAGEGALELADADVDSAERERDSGHVVSRVVVRYRERHEAGTWQAHTADRPGTQHRRGLPAPATAEVDLLADRLTDAQAYASRRLAMDGAPTTTWTVEAGARGLLLEPGDAVRLRLTRPAVAQLLEVAEIRRDLGAHRATLVLVDRRGFGPRGAWWTGDAPAFPPRLGGGAASPWSTSWTADQKAWGRENLAFWCDDDGYPATGETDERSPTIWS